MTELIFATGNKGKLAEVKKIFENSHFKIISLYDLGVVPEIEETGSTFEENALIKAEAIYNLHKIPVIADGIKACKYFSDKGIKTNVTLIFSAGQALLAAKAGATYMSPFIGRLDDISTDGLGLISEIRLIYDNYGYETQILAASVRHTMHILDCAKIGADVMTGPLNAIKGLLKHPLTDIVLAQFLEDYKKGN